MGWSKYFNRGFLRGRRPEPVKPGSKEYTFIWYHKYSFKKAGTSELVNSYSEAFRTTVSASSYEEAKDKVTDFALGKHSLVIWDEKEYTNSGLGKLNKEFKDAFKKMNAIFDQF